MQGFGFNSFPDKRIAQRPGGLAVTFDGGRNSHLLGASILEKYGGRGTFFINYSTIGETGVLTASQIVALAAKGHEIGAYGSSGANLTTLSEADANTQLATAQSTIFAQTGIIPRSCAYPLGGGEIVTHRLASRYYDRVRKNAGRWMDIGNSFIVWVPESTIVTDKQYLLDLVRHCALKGKSLAITVHAVDTSGDATSISPTDFETVIALAYSLGFPITTLANLTPPYNMIPDPWWEYSLVTRDTGMGWQYSSLNAITETIDDDGGPWGGKALVFGSATGVGQIHTNIPINPKDTEYLLRVPYKIEGLTAGSLNILVLYYDQTGNYISASTSTDYTADTPWTLHKKTLTAPANTRIMRVRLTHASATNAEAVISIGRCMLYPTWAGDFGENPS